MIFVAELRETKQTKAVSNDNVYSLKFVTDNPMVMDLGKLPSKTLFKITIDLAEEPTSPPHDAENGEEASLSFD